MKRLRHLFIGVFLLLFLIAACSSVPISQRRQLNLIPSSSIMSMSLKQYDQFLKDNELSEDKEKTRMVKRVGRRISEAVEKYFAERGNSERMTNYQWEFNLVESEEVNAWAMPGGKVVVYSGLLPVAETEAGLAVVMGHEIAHAVARHGNERMSQALLAQFGAVALSQAIREKPAVAQQLWMMAYGVGSQLGVMLPYSRLHEKEADHLGLIFMAMAGYDPRVAVDFWQRMADKKEGKSPPEFLSTHPPDQKRIAAIKEMMPEALRYYEKE
ncbi:MAG: M48 family metallopeptidase [Desulfosalsimonadaceae bacterium]